MSQQVTFRRINGRVVPIRSKGANASKKKRGGPQELGLMSMPMTRNVSAGERAGRGLVVGAKLGGGVGAFVGAGMGLGHLGPRGILPGALAGAVGGATQWGLLGALGNVAFGSRTRTEMVPGRLTYIPPARRKKRSGA